MYGKFTIAYENADIETNKKNKGMTIREARRIIEQAGRSYPSQEEEFQFVEALEFLISEENNPEDMMILGGYYYGHERFDLALKYYEMAAEFELAVANQGLGYLWYYGLCGEIDYEKAFFYFAKSVDQGNRLCVYTLADMIENGYYVEQNHSMYVELIEKAYLDVKDRKNLQVPVPEVFWRLAKIRVEQGCLDQADSLCCYAIDFLAQRLRYHAISEDLRLMKDLMNLRYSIIKFDAAWFQFYDLFYLLQSPVQICFTYAGKEQKLEALMEDGACVIHFNDKWYRNVDVFFANACVNNQRLTAVYAELDEFKIIGGAR